MSRVLIAKTLKRLRERAGLTTAQVGELVGKSQKTVSGWEHDRGQPDAEILMQLCDIYKVDDILAEFRADYDKKETPTAESDGERMRLLKDINSVLLEMNEEQFDRFYKIYRALTDESKSQ